jgi:transposase InsO family protein
MVGPAVKREGVVHLQAAMGLSERRACSIVGADRKMIRYRSCRPPDTELRTQLRDLANERKRFGCRRLFILLRQEGEPSAVNRIYRLYRLYREEGLTVRKRRTRRRAAGTRAPILVEAAANARWSVDFVHDQTESSDRRCNSARAQEAAGSNIGWHDRLSHFFSDLRARRCHARMLALFRK